MARPSVSAAYGPQDERMAPPMRILRDIELSRRGVLVGAAASAAATAAPRRVRAQAASAASEPVVSKVSLEINGAAHQLEIDTRTSLLDALREHLHLTGTKKG